MVVHRLQRNTITLWNPETSDVMNTFPNPSFMLTADQLEFSVAATASSARCYSPFALIPDTNRLIATSPVFSRLLI